MKNQELKEIKDVKSVKEAIAQGYKYVIAWRDHYNGNSKGEIYLCNEGNAHVGLSHHNMDDRGIYRMQATNEDVPKLIARRTRLINLLQKIEHSMTVYSPQYTGTIRTYFGHKMVFGNWRVIYKNIWHAGATYKCNFFSRHEKILSCLKNELKKTDEISISMRIIE